MDFRRCIISMKRWTERNCLTKSIWIYYKVSLWDFYCFPVISIVCLIMQTYKHSILPCMWHQSTGFLTNEFAKFITLFLYVHISMYTDIVHPFSHFHMCEYMPILFGVFLSICQWTSKSKSVHGALLCYEGH